MESVGEFECDAAVDEGIEAYRAGKTIDECPHEVGGVLWQYWGRGFASEYWQDTSKERCLGLRGCVGVVA